MAVAGRGVARGVAAGCAPVPACRQFFHKEFHVTISTFVRCGVVAGTLACAAFLSACDRTVETKSKTTAGPGGTSEKTQTTVQHSDGTVTVDKESSSSTPK